MVFKQNQNVSKNYTLQRFFYLQQESYNRKVTTVVVLFTRTKKGDFESYLFELYITGRIRSGTLTSILQKDQRRHNL